MATSPPDSWLDRRQRAVRCKRHGLHYDPALTSGCALCRKEGLLDLPVKKPQLLLLLLALFGIALISLRLSGPLAETLSTLGDEPPPADRTASATPSTVERLSSAAYQSELAAVEDALYRPTTGDPVAVAESIVEALAALAARLADAGTEGSREAATVVARLANEIAPREFTLAELPPVRRSWRRIRDRRFVADAETPAAGLREPAYEPAALAGYREAADRLVALVEDGRRLAQPLAEPRRPWAAEADRAERREAWQPLRRDWQERLDRFAGDLPPRPPASAPTEVLDAVSRLESALAAARALAADPELPLGEGATERFDDVAAAARDAAAAFDDPGLGRA